MQYKVIPANQIQKGQSYAPFVTKESATTVVQSGIAKNMIWEDTFPPPHPCNFAIVEDK